MRLSLWITVWLAAAHVGAQPREPHRYFKDVIGLSDAEIRQVEQGHVVAKVLETPLAHEVAIFGAVWVEATTDYFVEKYEDIESFEKGDGVLQIHKIDEPLKFEDFTGIRFPEADIKAIPKCKIGKCAVKIDETGLVRLQSEIDWKAPDAESKAQSLIAEIAYEYVREYQKGGDATLAAYRDKKRPTYLAKEFKGMLENSSFLYEYFPEFNDYLLGYPKAMLPGSTDFFYWSLNDFGLKPLFRMNHVVIYPLGEDHNAGVVIACKMLYASHYFHSALELRFLVRDTANPTDVGFFMISVNRSRSDGLTGFFGSILKRQAVKRARDGLAGVLANGKKNLEAGYKESE
ncbi:MAG: hypothetical protein E2P02_12210 [Acidobacteria bacterium]|nr:MAG: hypothetical protein E2P02_12210 [Acidobacteriota bacterium]